MRKLSNIFIARLFMLILAFIISVNGALTNWLLDFFPIWEVIFFNAFTCLFVSTCLILYKGKNNFKVNNITKHFIRVFSMVLAFIIYVFSIHKFLIVEVMAIYNFAPVLSSVLAIFILKERFNIFRFMAILLGFLGVLLVIQPGSEFFKFTLLLPILGSFFVSVAYVVTRSIMKIDNVYVTVFYYSLGLLIVSLFFFQKNFIFPTFSLLLLLLVTGLFSVVSHYLFALAVKFGEVSSVAPLEYTAFIWTGFLGYFIFNEIPNYMVITGGIIIIISGIYLFKSEKKLII